MIKFYYGAPTTSAKVALMLEETGLPTWPVDTRKGDDTGDQSERQGADHRRRRRHGVRLERHFALSRRKDRQVPARQYAEGARASRG